MTAFTDHEMTQLDAAATRAAMAADWAATKITSHLEFWPLRNETHIVQVTDRVVRHVGVIWSKS
jgi:hypothetical protein